MLSNDNGIFKSIFPNMIIYVYLVIKIIFLYNLKHLLLYEGKCQTDLLLF